MLYTAEVVALVGPKLGSTLGASGLRGMVRHVARETAIGTEMAATGRTAKRAVFSLHTTPLFSVTS